MHDCNACAGLLETILHDNESTIAIAAKAFFDPEKGIDCVECTNYNRIVNPPHREIRRGLRSLQTRMERWRILGDSKRS